MSFCTEAFDFHSIDWIDTSLGFALNPRTNIRPSEIEVKYSGLLYTKNNPIIEPIPILFFRFANIFINKDGGGMAFAHTTNFKLRAFIMNDGEGYKTEGMSERKNSFFAGGLLQLYFIQFKYMRDIEKISNGQNLRVDLFKEHYWGQLKFEPHFGIQYWSKDYVNYYYGVKANETSTNRPLYNPKGTVNYTVELRFIQTSGNAKYILIPMYKNYGKEVARSPVVERDEEFRLTFGVLWKLF